jgi:hypothetical protein
MERGIRYIISEIRENFGSPGWWRNRVIVPYVLGTASRFHPRYPGYGEVVHVMEEDWDNLIVLDACRADVFEEEADLEQFDEYRRETSLGSHSSEWTKRNFGGQQFGDTVYVSANPHTGLIVPDSFHRLVELRETHFDDQMETVLPDQMVETVLETHEQHPDKRLIAHFMQPHAPFVHEEASPPPFEGDLEEFWREYRRTLRYVLTYAIDLAEELGGKTVITADHGQTREKKLFGLLEINPHPPRLRLPELVTVPWATIEGDCRDIEADEVNELDPSDDVEDRLRHLGYR